MILQLFYFYIILEGDAHSSKNQNAMERHTEKSGSHPLSPRHPSTIDDILLDFWCSPNFSWGFPDSSVGKESACNAGDPNSIPGSGRSPGEKIGYPFQYSWASLMAQTVKNPPAVQEAWV